MSSPPPIETDPPPDATFVPPDFVPNNYLDTGPPPKLPDLGTCYVYDRRTGDGTTEFMFQACNAYTYPGNVYFTPTVTNPSAPTSLPETGSTMKLGMLATLCLGLGIVLCRVRARHT